MCSIASCYYRVPLMAGPPGVGASDVAGILATRPPASDSLLLAAFPQVQAS
jgi:hypothetical protein